MIILKFIKIPVLILIYILVFKTFNENIKTKGNAAGFIYMAKKAPNRERVGGCSSAAAPATSPTMLRFPFARCSSSRRSRPSSAAVWAMNASTASWVADSPTGWIPLRVVSGVRLVDRSSCKFIDKYYIYLLFLKKIMNIHKYSIDLFFVDNNQFLWMKILNPLMLSWPTF